MIQNEVEDDWLDVSNQTSLQFKAPRAFKADFSPCTVVYIAPLPGFEEPPTVTILDMSLDRLANHKHFTATGVTWDGIVVDVSALPLGCYPYAIGQQNEGRFSVSHDSPMYLSDNYPSAVNGPTPIKDDNPQALQSLVRHPIRHYAHDAWKNVISEKDAFGHETRREYNVRNQETRMTQPRVEVTTEQGQRFVASPITQKGYNARGFWLGQIDPKGHTTGFLLNEAGATMTEFAANRGVPYLHSYDGFLRETGYRDARNNWWMKTYNRNNQLNHFQWPLGWRAQSFVYNENGKVSVSNDSQNRIKHSNYDALGFVEGEFEPLGEFTHYQNERHGKPVVVSYPDNTALNYTFDYFGVMHSHRDLSGAVYTPTYDNKNQLLSYQSQGGNHGFGLRVESFTLQGNSYNLPTIFPVPAVSKIWRYMAGRVTEEFGSRKHTAYGYDLERRPIFSELYEANQLQQTLRTSFDALGREIQLFDTTLTLDVGYDLADNRVYMGSQLYLDPTHPRMQARWNTFSPTNNIIYDGGSLVDGKVVLGSGYLYQYTDGLRTHEQHGIINTTLSFNQEMLLYDVRRSDGKWVTRSFNNAADIQQITNSEGETLEFNSNQNGWATSQVVSKNNPNKQIQSSVSYPSLSKRGFPLTQMTQAYSYKNNDPQSYDEDDLSHHYVYYDDPKTSEVGGTKKRVDLKNQESKTSDYQSLTLYHDENGNVIAIAGQLDPEDPNLKSGNLVTLSVTNDGLILSKAIYHNYNGPRGRLTPANKIRYFFTLDKKYLGQYDPQSGTADLGLLHYGVTNRGGKAIGIPGDWRGVPQSAGAFQYADPTASAANLPKTTERNKNPALEFSFPSATPTQCAVQAYDTAESIAARMYGSASLASQIIAANAIGGQTNPLYTGYPGLRLPAALPTLNQAGMYSPYHQFVNTILGSLYPYLPTPEIEYSTNWMLVAGKAVLAALAIGAAALIAPPLVGLIMGSGALAAGGFFSVAAGLDAILMGTIAGIGNAASQELLIGLGYQEHFSWREVNTATLGATIGAVGALAWGAAEMNAAKEILRAALDAVSQQLGQLAIGYTNKFDLLAVANVIVSTTLAQGMGNFLPQRFKMPLSNLSVAVLNPLTHTGRIDLDLVAAQAIGTAAGNLIVSGIGYIVNTEAQRLQNYTHAKKGSIHEQDYLDDSENTPAPTNPTHRQRLNQLSEEANNATSNSQERLKRFQSTQAKPKNWQRHSNPPDPQIGSVQNSAPPTAKSPTKPKERWEQSAAEILFADTEGSVAFFDALATDAKQDLINFARHPLSSTAEFAEETINGFVSIVTHPKQVWQGAKDLYHAYKVADPKTQAQMQARGVLNLLEGEVITAGVGGAAVVAARGLGAAARGVQFWGRGAGEENEY